MKKQLNRSDKNYIDGLIST